MRIISGIAKGRKLSTPPPQSQDIRPTSDRAREALFNIIGNTVRGSRVLDLFAGTGALGLESLSRGAESAVLVDFHQSALALIKKNIEIFHNRESVGHVYVIRHDLRKGLPVKLFTAKDFPPFSLIFLDPPYSKGLSLNILEWLANNMQIYTHDALIVVEERSSEKLPEQFGILQLSDQRTYGDTGFWFYTPCASTSN